ncbi:protocatechuate 3,4-dioxygenase subunit alpha [Gordonia sp. VNQ95]|jgi:protocatechuate 3,4-dioxygenase alpha subunit|uniref:protocatechuate 3,4-dioxygenase subunit alpha n=1 Tax=Gordonia TaxID=2053 RepID=UPI0032B54A4C
MTTLLPPTPAQTIGPFYGYALPFGGDNELVPPRSPDAVRFHGQVVDGDGQPVPDVLLEIWQANADGTIPRTAGSLKRDGWTFSGWGRCATDDAGDYSFSTVPPGPIGGAAPYFLLTVFGRGLLHRLFTRAYLPGPLTDEDTFLAGVPAERRHTLIAERDRDGYRFDIHLQGEDETVFLHYPGQ